MINDKPLYKKNDILEWSVEPSVIIDKNKNIKYYSEHKYFFIFIFLLFLYLFSKLSFTGALFILASSVWFLAMFIFGSDGIKNRSSSFKYTINKKGISVKNLTRNENKFYNWNSLKYFYYNRKGRSKIILNTVSNEIFFVTVIGNNMQRTVMQVPLKYIDEVDNLFSDYLPFKYTVIKRNKALDLIILLIAICLLLMIYLMKWLVSIGFFQSYY